MFWDVTKSRLKSEYILKSENMEFVFPLSLHPSLLLGATLHKVGKSFSQENAGN